MIRKLARSIRQYKRDTILTPLSMTLEVIMEVLLPIIMADLIDNGISAGNSAIVWRDGLLLAGVSILSLLSGLLGGVFGARASSGFARNLRHDMYYRLQDYSFSNIDKFSTSSLITRLTTDVSNVQNAFQMLIRMAARSPLMLIFSGIMAFCVNARLALIFLCVVPFLAVGLTYVATHAHPVFRKVFKTYDSLNNVVQENVRGMRVVKSFVREDYEDKKFEDISGQVCTLFTKAERIIALNSPLMQFAMYACTLLISWFGAKFILSSVGQPNAMTTGELNSLLTYSMQILGSLMMLSFMFVMLTISRASGERICEVLDKGFRPRDIMILVRGATDGAKVAAELLDFKRRNEDPRYRFDVMTQEALIVGNAPVSSFIAAALRLALNPDDSLSRAVYNHYLGRPFDRPLDDSERDFFRSVRLLSPEEAFERIVMRHALQGDRRQTAYLQAIHEQIISFCATKIADIALFLRWWEETGKNRSLSVEESATTVEITTIHKAKGLEKRAVLIPYCSWSPDPKSSGTVQNIVWAEARGDGAEAIGRFPVRYKKAMAESGFSSEYYRELVYAHVDNVNLLYVALTRAAESLHVFIPQKGGRTVGGLLLQSIATDGDKALLGDFEGRCTIDEAGEHFAFGEFAGPVAGGSKRSEAEHVILEEYPTAQADLRLRLPSQRYFEDGGEVELSPRNLGILMHRAFEQADDEAGIHEAVRGMQADGTLSEADAATLRQMIARALEHPEVREWFGGGWERVRNENEIIIPGRGSTRRPDRVMIDGRRVVVVDYKFGLRDAERHRRQMREYLRLLGEMGYAPAEGYLWYVKLGKIEKVEP